MCTRAASSLIETRPSRWSSAGLERSAGSRVIRVAATGARHFDHRARHGQPERPAVTRNGVRSAAFGAILPIRREEGAMSQFELPSDHPGFSDQDYRARRAAIAAVGDGYQSGEPIPHVVYTPEEDEVWRIVTTELARTHGGLGARAGRGGAAARRRRGDRVPRPDGVSGRLGELTGFHVEPVPGLVPPRRFYGALADRAFLSTQY